MAFPNTLSSRLLSKSEFLKPATTVVNGRCDGTAQFLGEFLMKDAYTQKKFYATLITLSNHTPFEDTDKYGYYDVSMTVDGVKYDYMENTKLGNYFKSVHYADEQIGLLIEELEKENMLDDTVIVIYGDHDARISKSEWDRFYNYDYRTNDVKSSSDETLI